MKIKEVIILCGGAGTRLAAVVPDVQKTLAPVRGVPVLHMVIDGLRAQGFNRIILATGVRSEQVRKYIEKLSDFPDLEILISEEPSPLDTGGAIRNAVSLISSSHFLAINGDMFFKDIDFNDAFTHHMARGAAATLVAVRPRAEEDYGAMRIDTDGRASFREKEGAGDLMSAGAYWMERAAVAALPEGPLSIEKDVFPMFAARGILYGYRSEGMIHDIGTPERYRNANEGNNFV